MSRRSFLERIAALIGIGVAAPVARAVATRRLELQRSPVAGFQYHQGEAVWPLLMAGAALSLVREPDNAYDPRAVRVDWQGRKLGYVPHVDNAAVSHLLDAGHALHAEIVSLRESNDPWDRVEFSIFLADQGAGG
ncbi:MAG: HIRAN domain-containing protein [Rhodocyclaceae bacterium]|nr:HIRAN domain-containing protein [Rhodocyclaceae bacterium]